MKIIIKIAWRNIWRNSRRSWVLVSSIAVGVLGYLGTSSFSRGFLNQMVETTINLQGGHITIAASGYHDNPSIRRFLAHPDEIEKVLQHIQGIHYAPVVSFQGMISSSERTSGVVIHGVDPTREPEITSIAQSITKGTYFGGNSDLSGILLGQALAQRLNVDVGEKVVLMTSDLDRNITSGAYRVVGLFQTPSPDFDKAFVFLRKEVAQKLAGYDKAISSFTIRADRVEDVEPIMAQIKSHIGAQAIEVLSWKDRNKLLVLALKLYDFSIVIMVVILFIAIAFSIANAFLMVIYERIYEIGVMMANGVLPIKIRRMLYTEAFFITMLGTLFGLALTAVLIGYFAYFGLDLSDFAKGLGKFGVGSVVYPSVVPFDVIAGLITINLIVFLSVLYPSIKASKFEVVDAVRFV